ncbi:hypothetical protein HYFRA_00006936 [Hymenoscyphus fraxineus]|uniref:Uncharacterized protein n=1 Tax=Hymenoscyphus fraxineus TaxID=746836 RepID=A0A9N9KMD9_9HELO|nr:hypothetical protein HYFRA_00006936 [Hymenoscyphus fraxineus]
MTTNFSMASIPQREESLQFPSWMTSSRDVGLLGLPQRQSEEQFSSRPGPQILYPRLPPFPSAVAPQQYPYAGTHARYRNQEDLKARLEALRLSSRHALLKLSQPLSPPTSVASHHPRCTPILNAEVPKYTKCVEEISTRTFNPVNLIVLDLESPKSQFEYVEHRGLCSPEDLHRKYGEDVTIWSRCFVAYMGFVNSVTAGEDESLIPSMGDFHNLVSMKAETDSWMNVLPWALNAHAYLLNNDSPYNSRNWREMVDCMAEYGPTKMERLANT